MGNAAPQERLRRARAERGESLEDLSRRTGLRQHHLRAIEEARFSDLPAGLYGRAAVRAFAEAYSLDAEDLLAGCEALLPTVEDPIGALARLRGLAANRTPVVRASPGPSSCAEPGWRPFAAATVDGIVAGVLLVLVTAAAALLARVSIAALGPAAVTLFLVGLVLGSAYYLWLGGLSGTTFGEYAVGPGERHRDPRPLTLRAIALRAIAAATADTRAIYALGVWVGRRVMPAGRTVQPPVPLPSAPPPPGREEVLTWSMSRRVSVPPPPLRPRRG